MSQYAPSVVRICRRAVSFYTTTTATPTAIITPLKTQHHSSPVQKKSPASPSPNTRGSKPAVVSLVLCLKQWKFLCFFEICHASQSLAFKLSLLWGQVSQEF